MKDEIIFLLVALVFTCNLFADDKSRFSVQPEIKYSTANFSESHYNGLPSGGSYKMNETSWKLDNVLAGGKFSLALNKLEANFGAWKSIGNGKADVDYYRWTGTSLEVPAEDKLHSNIESDVLILDFDLGIEVFAKKNFSLFALAGFRFEKWSLEDSLSELTYLEEDFEGNVSGSDVVFYSIVKGIPYIGLKPYFKFNNFTCSLDVNYTPFAYANSESYYALSKIRKNGYLDYANIVFGEIDLRYDLNNNFYLTIGADASFTFETFGNYRINFEGSGNSKDALGACGFEGYVLSGFIGSGFSL